ncbi:hypothetical protein K458DRAFT_401647 [Lentithecium fluviatile CBS 122367]|uniref:Uncharacterized protein n=1 Tax=Lentithecium fluviatile CBS 122367 TaxID=1168545 RepID=A0A6G1J940_9PLEO|nr:hypothetical protein K458DRAFT_401647 [Lentithecium fluviatile CBS 122367]
MTFKRLAIRTKKSLSGLYSFNNDQSPTGCASMINRMLQTVEANLRSSDSTSSQTSPNRDFAPYSIDEFGGPAAGDCSPVRDSPSRRKRLLGSLRSIGSLRSLRSAHNNPKPWDDSPEKPEPNVPQTPAKEMPSLALNFEVSPPDQPMFAVRKTSSSSSMFVHRSSPISVPPSAKQPAPAFNTPPGLSAFTVGTMPESPAPLQRASVQEAILSGAADTVLVGESPSSVTGCADPLPTPMPGTNLPLDDCGAPAIVVSSPSAPSMLANVAHAGNNEDYFSVKAPEKHRHEREDSVVTSDELDPAADAEIIALLVMNAETVPDHPPESLSGKLEPLHSDEVASLHTEDAFTLDSPTRRAPDAGDIGGDLAYVVWDDPAIANEDKCQLERGASTWSRHTGHYDGTGYGNESTRKGSQPSTSDHTEADTEATDLTVPDEEVLNRKFIDATVELVKDAVQPEVQVFADDKETLQDIIRAYAGPMLYHEEAEAHHASEYSDDFSEIQSAPLDEVTSANVRAEVEDSIRVMSRSLGG